MTAGGAMIFALSALLVGLSVVGYVLLILLAGFVVLWPPVTILGGWLGLVALWVDARRKAT